MPRQASKKALFNLYYIDLIEFNNSLLALDTRYLGFKFECAALPIPIVTISRQHLPCEAIAGGQRQYFPASFPCLATDGDEPGTNPAAAGGPYADQTIE
jgi:hypothetical protein